MNTVNTMTEVATPPVAQPVPAAQPRPEASPVLPTGPRRFVADWPILIMIVCSCLLAGAFATYILVPVTATVTAASADNWANQGP